MSSNQDDLITISLPDSNDIDFSTYTLSANDQFDFNWSVNPGIDVTAGDVKIHDEGDIKLGDQSLKEFMSKVEERLNILHPNPELEEKWEALRELGDKYRQLEKELQEKEKMWDLLRNQ